MQAHQKGSESVSAKNANERLAEEEARADAMITELNAPPAAEPAAPNPPAAPEPAAAPAEPAPAAGEPAADTQEPIGADAAATPEPGEPEPEPQATPASGIEASIHDLEARLGELQREFGSFNTLKGKYKFIVTGKRHACRLAVRASQCLI